MSLHTLAHHLQSAGRGDDKVLVHMTPGEVNGLQSLAMAHGGSLTINPQTGLPEAGFLSSLLPMLAGGALMVMSGGAINPLTAGFLVGGGTAAVTGSLKKGLLAGLGAYSGAGLGAGLTSMGTSAAAPTTSFSAPTSVAPQVAGTANTVAPATTTAGAPTEIFSGGISRPPLALQGAGPGGYGAAQPGIFTPGSYGGTAIPAPTPGPVTASRVPSELYSGVETSTRPWMTNLPQANPPIDLQSYQTAGKMPDAVRTVTVPSTGAYEPVGTKFDITGTTKAAVNQPQLETYTYKPGDYLDPGSFTTVEAPTQSAMDKLGAGFKKATTDGLQGLKDLRAASEAAAPYGMYAGLGSTAYTMYEEKRKEIEEEMRRRKAEQDTGMIRPYTFDYGATNIAATPYGGSAERTYFQPSYTALTPYKAPGPEYAAEGGLMGLAVGGAVEDMAAQNAIGANTGYPMANLQTTMYSNPSIQRPQAGNVIAPSADTGVDVYTGEARFARGGISHLGDYSDGGRLLKGPGDGVSDSIPASIGDRQPARLADGEFVVPARIVSEIGNGSTEAGARKLYAMMDRVQRARRKTTGKGKVAVNTKAEKLLPA